MTTAAMVNRNGASLEELVGRLIDALRWETAPAKESGLVRGIHEARRFRQAGDIEGTLGLLSGNGRGCPGRGALGLHRVAGPGAEAVRGLEGHGVQVRARADLQGRRNFVQVVVTGMRWQTGKPVFGGNLRNLRHLAATRHHANSATDMP